MAKHSEQATCAVCHRSLPVGQLRPAASVSEGIAALIRADVPDWQPDAKICREDLARYRRRYVEDLLATERGTLTALDREVLQSMETGGILAVDTASLYEERLTFGGRAADTVATFGGSWTFIMIFSAALIVWMALNVSGAFFRSFDPYPFILLNLVLSCVAAMQAPIIMMSQRRQESKDRLRAENDYKVNLKAELEIRHLHEKIDHQLTRQWERLVEIQRIQIEMLEDAASRRPPR